MDTIIPGHYNIGGIEKEDRLALKGSGLEQLSYDLSYQETKQYHREHYKVQLQLQNIILVVVVVVVVVVVIVVLVVVAILVVLVLLVVIVVVVIVVLKNKQYFAGRPLLTQVIQKLGGWKVLGNWKNGTWDLNTVMQKVQSDFGVPAFYSYTIQLNNKIEGEKIISLKPTTLGQHLFRRWFYYSGWMVKSYKKLMKIIGKSLVRDASALPQFPPMNENLTKQLLNQFINDSFTMEKNMLTSAREFWYNPSEYTKMSLGNLTTYTGGLIDWTSQIAYLLDNAGINASTEVLVVQKKYFKGWREAALPSWMEYRRHRSASD
ncbi:endothelin-converting enzyme 1 [Elysia marginata]|uniref:Endothelin-converting enzyme 1 n=1 Tax=Elysia marginata TaxID=1093978 RepID=A0AAV4JLX6_9GAST|nr:endothelin-converting enzyme 1 [Elysia marginata]